MSACEAGQCADCDDATMSQLCTARYELQAEVVKLRERVRFHAINIEPFDHTRGDGTWIGCDECLSAWPEGEPESHGHDCIAALQHKSVERKDESK